MTALTSEIPEQAWQAAGVPVLESVDRASPQPTRRTSLTFTSGGAFVLDAPETVPVIWGDGPAVLWPRGECLQVVGPPGTGKTTLVGQLVRARLGLQHTVLNWPVTAGSRRVLYLAMDRPSQIQRALRRNFADTDRETLDQRLVVWKGPPPADFAKHTGTLLAMCQDADADTVVVDSLKDAAVGLSDDEVGSGYNRARQLALVNGVEVLELHHQVKRGANGGKPNTLADVYGSAWLTAGAGSVVLLWGAAGDPIVELEHLKPPAESVGPLRVIHDHAAGVSSVWHSVDLLALAIVNSGHLTARLAAMAINDTDKPDRNQIEKARRQLERLTTQGHLIRTAGRPGGLSGGTETTYGRAQ